MVNDGPVMNTCDSTSSRRRSRRMRISNTCAYHRFLRAANLGWGEGVPFPTVMTASASTCPTTFYDDNSSIRTVSVDIEVFIEDEREMNASNSFLSTHHGLMRRLFCVPSMTSATDKRTTSRAFCAFLNGAAVYDAIRCAPALDQFVDITHRFRNAVRTGVLTSTCY